MLIFIIINSLSGFLLFYYYDVLWIFEINSVCRLGLNFCLNIVIIQTLKSTFKPDKKVIETESSSNINASQSLDYDYVND